MVCDLIFDITTASRVRRVRRNGRAQQLRVYGRITGCGSAPAASLDSRAKHHANGVPVDRKTIALELAGLDELQEEVLYERALLRAISDAARRRCASGFQA
jgi:hypothetical protein